MDTAAATAQEQPLSPILIAACLDDLTHALSDRPSVPEDQRLAHASATQRLILSFQPQDAMQLMLAGHAVLFNALTADGARDIMRGMAEPTKSRARSNVTAMGRLVSKHIDTLTRLQGRANRVATLADTMEQIPTSAAEPPPRQPASDHEPPNPNEPGEASVTEAPAEAATETAARLYPGRETMLASRTSRVSRRKKAQLAHRLINVLRAAQAP